MQDGEDTRPQRAAPNETVCLDQSGAAIAARPTNGMAEAERPRPMSSRPWPEVANDLADFTKPRMGGSRAFNNQRGNTLKGISTKNFGSNVIENSFFFKETKKG